MWNMKKLTIRFGVLVMVIMSLLTLTACGDDDDPDVDPPVNLSSQIIGAWEETEDDDITGQEVSYVLTFNVDNDVRGYMYGVRVFEGKYSIKGNKVKMSLRSIDNPATVEETELTVISINKREMTIVDEDGITEDLDKISNDGNYVPKPLKP